VPVPFDRVADRYDDTRGGSARGGRIGADVHRWLAPGPVLEVGVGTGLVAAELAARGHPVVGIDLSLPMLARARTRLPGRVLLADALALPFAGSTFGGVVFAAVLHLLDDVSLGLAEAARVLAPEGRVVIVHGRSVHDPDDIEGALAPLARLRSRRADSEYAILSAARAAGLRPVADTMTGKVLYAESPDEVADRIEERVWSYLWRVDDATWRQQVVPAIDLLRDLPRASSPRRRAARFALSVYGRRSA
jgi:SAM-dependent methyltransferase